MSIARIADALERIAAVLEQRDIVRLAETMEEYLPQLIGKPSIEPASEPKLKSSGEAHGITSDMVRMAERVAAGETCTAVGLDYAVRPDMVRTRVMRVFRVRNREKYEELRKKLPRNGRIQKRPLMQQLVAAAADFGFR